MRTPHRSMQVWPAGRVSQSSDEQCPRTRKTVAAKSAQAAWTRSHCSGSGKGAHCSVWRVRALAACARMSSFCSHSMQDEMTFRERVPRQAQALVHHAALAPAAVVESRAHPQTPPSLCM